MQRQFSLSVFAFIDSLVVSASQDAGGYATSRQNNLELHLGCHTCWLSYFTLVCLWCGRTVSQAVYGHVITKFSRIGRLLHFLTHGTPLARFASESSAIILQFFTILRDKLRSVIDQHPGPSKHALSFEQKNYRADHIIKRFHEENFP